MSRIREGTRHDARKTPEELEHEIDATRADLEETLEELERRLAPNALLNQALTQVRRHGGEFAQNLGDDVKQHPVPALLASIGIAWLMAANGRRPNGHPEANAETDRRLGNARHALRRGREAIGSAAERGRGAMHRAEESAREGVASSRAALSESRQALRSAGADVRGAAATTRRRARRARYDATRLLAEQPLLLGVIGLAAGAIAGATLPSSAEEDEAFGTLRDRAVARSKAAGASKLGKARREAEQALEGAPGGRGASVPEGNRAAAPEGTQAAALESTQATTARDGDGGARPRAGQQGKGQRAGDGGRAGEWPIPD